MLLISKHLGKTPLGELSPEEHVLCTVIDLEQPQTSGEEPQIAANHRGVPGDRAEPGTAQEPLPAFKADSSASWTQRIKNYWKRRAADHRPPPLKKPTNERGEILEWHGPAHRKPQTPLAEGEDPPKKRPRKKRNLLHRFWAPQQVRDAPYTCRAAQAKLLLACSRRGTSLQHAQSLQTYRQLTDCSMGTNEVHAD